MLHRFSGSKDNRRQSILSHTLKSVPALLNCELYRASPTTATQESVVSVSIGRLSKFTQTIGHENMLVSSPILAMVWHAWPPWFPGQPWMRQPAGQPAGHP